MSSEDVLLSLVNISKQYSMVRRPLRELGDQLFGKSSLVEKHSALHPISLDLRRGESLGIIGLNGAGKSTLLQIASGVLTPSSGSVSINGRLASLLELGSGLNPEANGLDNIYLYAAILGFPKRLTESRLNRIIAFSGLEDAIRKPVKTYSTGMQVRLAFSIATSVDPDILIIDEALSVGDGIFAKRSFDRIMELRARGTSLLFCSHALFHVDLFCNNTIWLDQGRSRLAGPTKNVLSAYRDFLDYNEGIRQTVRQHGGIFELTTRPELVRLDHAIVKLDGKSGKRLKGSTDESQLDLDLQIQVSSEEPQPRIAIVFSSETGRIIGTAISPPNLIEATDASGRCSLHFSMPQLPLNRGVYRVGIYLLCHQARFVYAWSDPYAVIEVSQAGPDLGPWRVSGQWDVNQPGST